MKWEKSSSLHPHLLNLLHFGRKHRNFHAKADYFRSPFDRKKAVRSDAMKGKEETTAESRWNRLSTRAYAHSASFDFCLHPSPHRITNYQSNTCGWTSYVHPHKKRIFFFLIYIISTRGKARVKAFWGECSPFSSPSMRLFSFTYRSRVKGEGKKAKNSGRARRYAHARNANKTFVYAFLNKDYCCPLNYKSSRFPYPQHPSIGVADFFLEK